MKQNTIIIILCVVLVALIAVAAVFYNKLSEDYVPSGVQPPETTDTTEDSDKATDFSMKDEEGNNIRLSDFFGKPIVLNFWATWCPPCKSELPAFENAYKNYGDKVQFIMLNQTDGARDTVEVVKKFVDDNGYTFPVYYDTEFNGTYAYSAFSIPMTVLIDADGNFVKSHVGAMSEVTLISYINELIK